MLSSRGRSAQEGAMLDCEVRQGLTDIRLCLSGFQHRVGDLPSHQHLVSKITQASSLFTPFGLSWLVNHHLPNSDLSPQHLRSLHTSTFYWASLHHSEDSLGEAEEASQKVTTTRGRNDRFWLLQLPLT